MADIFALCVPIFAIIAAGWVAARTGKCDVQMIASLSKFAVMFALPALVLQTISRQPIDQVFKPAFAMGFLLAGLIVFALTTLTHVRALGLSLGVAASQGASASIGNLGFLGVPLLVGLFGDRGAGPLAIAMVCELGVIMFASVALMAINQGKSAAISKALNVALRNPILGAVMIGLILSAAGTPLPASVDRFLAFLGAAAGPASLFALGASLAVRQNGELFALQTAGVVLGKLLIYPAIVGVVLHLVLNVDPFYVQAGMLIAALPTAGSVFAIAQHHNAEPERASAAVLATTAVAVMSFPAMAWLVMH